MKEYQINEILKYLKDNTPMIYDLDSEDLKYDKNNINYKIYKCIFELREENRKLKEK